jgi:hypothetical protein
MKNHGTCPRARRHQRDKAKIAYRAEKQKQKMERRKAKLTGELNNGEQQVSS